MALTKNDIISKIYKLGFTQKQAVDIVESLFEILKKNLEKNKDILITRFGKLCIKDKNSRKGRNPATGSDLILDAKRVVSFKCSGKLRKRISG
ncbi:MAG: integration host factor subunit alpha [Deltaproteobacteria bacterium]|nr:integration host factor subunit alpha [Deltaproteobacteria bacterium]